MFVLRNAQYLNVYWVYGLSTLLAIFLPALDKFNSSYNFIVIIIFLLCVAVINIFKNSANKYQIFEGLLFFSPVGISFIGCVVAGSATADLIVYSVLYSIYSVILAFFPRRSISHLEKYMSVVIISTIMLIPFAFVSLGFYGIFSPFKMLNVHDGSMSKNTFAVIIICGLCFTVYFTEKYGKQLYLYRVLFIAGLFLTGSRAGLLIGIYLLLFTKFSKKKIFLIMVTTGIVLAMFSNLDNSTQSTSVQLEENRFRRLWDTSQQLLTGDFKVENNADFLRVGILYGGGVAVLKSPIYGNGAGNSPGIIKEAVPFVYFLNDDIVSSIQQKGLGAHNFYLKILLEYGAFSIFQFYFFYRIARRIAQKNKIIYHGYLSIMLFSLTNDIPTALACFPIILIFYMYSLTSSNCK